MQRDMDSFAGKFHAATDILNQTFSDEATLDINRENALFTLQSDTTN
jgi:hypothetical protein